VHLVGFIVRMNFVGCLYITDMINVQKIEYVENVYYWLIRRLF
jgi:hypothetical protein